MSTRILISLESLFGAEAAERYQDYICPQCDEILKDAVQTNCSHFLCDDCAGFVIFRYKEQARCPQINCKKILRGDDGTDYFPDRHLRREIDKINKLQVECPLVACMWTGLYEEFMAHRQSQHPSVVWQSMSKRRASHTVVTIQHEQSLNQTSQPGKEPEQFPDVLDMLKNAKRLKADSLKTSQKKAGAEASSNQSLKRASESEPKAFQGQSDTLDASAACVQVHFETTPESEMSCKEEIVKKGKQQLVHGSLKKPSHQRNPSDVIPKPFDLPLLPPPAVEAKSQEPLDMSHGSASASIPRKNSQANRHRKSPPTFSLPPQSPRALIAPTHQPSTHTVLSPTTQFKLPTIPQASNMEQDSIPLQSPPHVPPPSILSTRRTPVPQALGKHIKANSLPQDSNKCCQCKRKDKQLKILQNAFKELLKENVSPTFTCNEKNSFHRDRFMSF